MSEISHEIILKNGKYRDLSIGNTDHEVMLKLYDFMLYLRRLQEEIINEYHPANEMRCPVHFCIGQESIPSALSQLICKNDYLLSHHRSHGYYLAKGGTTKALLAELYGRISGTNGGKAGSQEISQTSIHFYSGAILSGQLAIAVGVGLGFQLKSEDNVAIATFGDGAVDEGVFWEAMNYAQLCKLPVVFICENNCYSTYSPQLKRQPADDIHKRVAAFGLKTEAIFGNDVILAMSTLDEAIEYARQGRGPVLVEAYTYRWRGHVGPEDDDYVGYRPETEIEFWKQNCPILLLEEQMVTNNLLTQEIKEDKIIKINNEIAEAFKFAKESPFPDVADWEDHNYESKTPLADKLLADIDKREEFNQNQPETVPGPY